MFGRAPDAINIAESPPACKDHATTSNKKKSGFRHMISFKDSQAYAATRLSREAVRKIGRKRLLTKTECSILLRVSNLWHHHVNGSEVIYPGCAETAKIVGCDRRTVIRAFKRFRELGFMLPCGLEKGGSGATRYKVDAIAIWKFAGTNIPETIPGKLVEMHRHTENVTGDNPAYTRDKMSHDIINVGTLTSGPKAECHDIGPAYGEPHQKEDISFLDRPEVTLEEIEARDREEIGRFLEEPREPHGRPIPKPPIYPKSESWILSTFEKWVERPLPVIETFYSGKGMAHV